MLPYVAMVYKVKLVWMGALVDTAFHSIFPYWTGVTALTLWQGLKFTLVE